MVIITKNYLYVYTNTNLITMKYKVTLFSVATISATVFVDAISKEDAEEIATTSCNVDDFEINDVDPRDVEIMSIEEL